MGCHCHWHQRKRQVYLLRITKDIVRQELKLLKEKPDRLKGFMTQENIPKIVLQKKTRVPPRGAAALL